MDTQRKNHSCYHCHEEGGQQQHTVTQNSAAQNSQSTQKQTQQNDQAKQQQWCHDDCNC